MAKKENEKKISLRNYFLVLVVSVLVVAVALYIRAFYINYNNDAINGSVFDEKVNEININELGFTIPESGDAILFVSYSGDKDVYNMEKRLLKEIEKKSIIEKVLYLNVSEYKDKDEYVTLLKKSFPNIANQITSAPILIYIENGEAIEAMSSELKMIDYKVLNKILEKYELE